MPLLLIVLAAAACSTVEAGPPSPLLSPLEGGILGGQLGRSLDNAARKKAAEAEYMALESGQTGMPVEWRVSDSLFGKVVPQQPYAVGSTDCRRYVHTVNDNGRTRTAAGVACRNNEGIWNPVS